jgi:hypothetical protein
MLDFIMTASRWTNPCPRKPGAAQEYQRSVAVDGITPP